MTRSQKSQATAIGARSRPAVAPATRRLSVVDQIYRKHTLVYIPVAQLCANPRNVREDMGEIDEMAESIRQHGILTPLLICTTDAYRHKRSPDDPDVADSAQWVALEGNRRLLAAQRRGMTEVPAIVRDDLAGVSDAEIQLVSSLHRKDLEPLEQAEAFGRMYSLLGNQESVAARVGCDQGTVSRRMQLLSLPNALQSEMRAGKLSQAAALDLLKATTAELMVEAYALMTDPDTPSCTASDAVDKVRELHKHKRNADKSKRRITTEGLTVVNPAALWGSRSADRLKSHGERPVDHPSHCLAVSIDPDDDGLLDWYCTDRDNHGKRDDAAESRAAARVRARVALEDARTWRGAPAGALIVVDSVLAGLGDGPALRLALSWAMTTTELAAVGLTEELAKDGDKAVNWVDGLEGEARVRFAQLAAVATAEVGARRAIWGRTEALHARRLMQDANYQPTAWEREQLDRLAMIGEDTSCA